MSLRNDASSASHQRSIASIKAPAPRVLDGGVGVRGGDAGSRGRAGQESYGANRGVWRARLMRRSGGPSPLATVDVIE